jgi:hypothetical protein
MLMVLCNKCFPGTAFQTGECPELYKRIGCLYQNLLIDRKDSKHVAKVDENYAGLTSGNLY